MDLPIRKPNRLKHYQYTQNGGYFITICTNNRREILWLDNISSQVTPLLSTYGTIVDTAINAIVSHYSGVTVDNYVIMPNHVHLLLMINHQTNIISNKDIFIIVGQMKRWASKQCQCTLWQKSFHDHIIRNDHEYQKIWAYVDNNPIKWEEDCFNKRKK